MYLLKVNNQPRPSLDYSLPPSPLGGSLHIRFCRSSAFHDKLDLIACLLKSRIFATGHAPTEVTGVVGVPVKSETLVSEGHWPLSPHVFPRVALQSKTYYSGFHHNMSRFIFRQILNLPRTEGQLWSSCRVTQTLHQELPEFLLHTLLS